MASLTESYHKASATAATLALWVLGPLAVSRAPQSEAAWLSGYRGARLGLGKAQCGAIRARGAPGWRELRSEVRRPERGRASGALAGCGD